MASTTRYLSRRLRWTRPAAAGAAGLAIVLASQASLADEGGVSFWLPGLFGSLAAAPLQPGWSVAETFYHTSVWGGKDVAVSREITIGRFNPTLHTALSASVQSDANLVFASATYVFASPVLGGQATIGLAEA